MRKIAIRSLLLLVALCEFGSNHQVSWVYPPRVGNHTFAIFLNRRGVELVHTDRNKQIHAESIVPYCLRINF